MDTTDSTLTDPLVGRVVDARYRVVARLARGGMATVYEAIDVRLERTVALKVMHPALADDAEFVARFVREARAAARLSHPNVVAMFDQGTDGDLVYLVMEYVPSLNLREVLRDRGHLTVEESFDVMEPVLSALAAAHAAGIVHRDVKPENVLLAQDGRVLVADFGLARATSSVTSATTQGVLIGTVAYLAPEQVERGIADPRSDVYAAGIVLYEMLTGAPPFAGETPLSVAYQHVNGVVPRPSATADVPEAVDALLAGATQRDADGRYSDAGRFLDALRATRSRLDLPAYSAGPTTSPRALNDTLVVPRTPHGAAPVAGPAIATPDRHTQALSLDDAADLGPDGPDGVDIHGRPERGTPRAPAAALKARRRARRRRGLVALLLVIALGVAVGFLAFDLGNGKQVDVPAVATLDQDDANAKLRAAGFVPVAGERVFSETVAKGDVIRTSPRGGEGADEGSEVVMTISKGPERYDVPAVEGVALNKARDRITGAHLAVGDVKRQYSDTVRTDAVIAVSPAPGRSVKPDTVVDLVVSRGPAPVDVPNVVGSTRSAATSKLTKAGLKLGDVREQHSEAVARGVVISQSPGKGTSVLRGDAVDLVVSKGPPLVAVPNVFGMRVGNAVRELEAVGFLVRKEALLGGLLGVVQSQSPSGGSKAPKGSTITIKYV